MSLKHVLYACAGKAITFYRKGAMLAPIRLTNAAAQLPCGSGETQGDASPPPLRGLRDRFAHQHYLMGVEMKRRSYGHVIVVRESAGDRQPASRAGGEQAA